MHIFGIEPRCLSCIANIVTQINVNKSLRVTRFSCKYFVLLVNVTSSIIYWDNFEVLQHSKTFGNWSCSLNKLSIRSNLARSMLLSSVDNQHYTWSIVLRSQNLMVNEYYEKKNLSILNVAGQPVAFF